MRRAWEAMSGKKLVHVSEDAPMEQAFELMQEHRVRHLPVIATRRDGPELVGIISDRDVQRAMKSEMRWETSIHAKVPQLESVDFDPESRVRHYMSWPVKLVDLNTDLRTVAGLMVSDKISSLVVMDGDHYVGIVTTEDLLKIFMQMLGNGLTRSTHATWDLRQAVESATAN